MADFTGGEGGFGSFGIGDSDFGFDVAALEESLRREADRVRDNFNPYINITMNPEILKALEDFQAGNPYKFFDLNLQEEGPADIVAEPAPTLEDYVTGIVINGTPGFVPGPALCRPG